KLPQEKNEDSFILVDEIIRQNIKNFFRGYEVKDYALFRVLKDQEISVEEEFAPDLLKAIESEVKRRSWAKVVYLEVEKKCAPELLELLCSGLAFTREEVVPISGHMDLTYLFEMPHQLEKPELFYKSFVPAKVPYENIFAKINEGDFTVHLPFQAFYPTI